MKILFISPDSPYESIGGIERYLANLISYSESRNKNIVVLLPSFGEESSETNGSVTIIKSSSMALLGKGRGGQRFVREKARDFAKIVEEIILDHQIDAICAENFHCSLPPAFSIQLNMVANAHSMPTILHVHSFSSSPLQAELLNQLMWDKVFCVSKSVAGDCYRKGADVDILKTHYLGVDTDLFKKSSQNAQWLKDKLGLEEQHKVVLSASRITSREKDILQEKGIIDTIRAFAKLAPYYPELRLVFATATPYEAIERQFGHAREKLLGYLKLNGIAEKARVEVFTMEEMPMAYNRADVFVLPSENETFGQVFTEAMACGTPVIGTKVGGIPEVIRDGHNGFLVSPNDPTSLSQRMEKLLCDEDLCDRFVKQARADVEEKFKAEKQFNSLYESIGALVV